MKTRDEKILFIDYKKLSFYLTEREIRRFEQTLRKLKIVFDKMPYEFTYSLQSQTPHNQPSTYIVYRTNYLDIKLNFNPYQIQVESIKEIALNALETEEINKAMRWGAQYLRFQGYRQYLFYRDKKSMRFLPIREKGKMVDANAKVARLHYLFWQDDSLLTTDSIFSSHKPANKGLHFQYETIWNNIDLFNRNTEMKLFQNLKERNVITYIPTSNYEYIKTTHVKINGCAFCKEHIKHNQMIMDCGGLLILANYAPTTDSEWRFLLLPSSHIEDWSELDVSVQSYLPYVVTSLTHSIQFNTIVSAKKMM